MRKLFLGNSRCWEKTAIFVQLPGVWRTHSRGVRSPIVLVFRILIAAQPAGM
jgi:hypothetical protein